jgi:hypothetical protein
MTQNVSISEVILVTIILGHPLYKKIQKRILSGNLYIANIICKT